MFLHICFGLFGAMVAQAAKLLGLLRLMADQQLQTSVVPVANEVKDIVKRSVADAAHGTSSSEAHASGKCETLLDFDHKSFPDTARGLLICFSLIFFLNGCIKLAYSYQNNGNISIYISILKLIFIAPYSRFQYITRFLFFALSSSILLIPNNYFAIDEIIVGKETVLIIPNFTGITYICLSMAFACITQVALDVRIQYLKNRKLQRKFQKAITRYSSTSDS